MIVGKAIYYLLTNATDVTDVVSTRIYPEIAQQDADLPFIVYNVTNNEPTDTKPEPSKLDTAQVEVNIYAESYTDCIDLAVAVRAALDRVKGTYNGVNVQSIQYQNEIIDFDEPQRAYNISADYDVRISRSGFEIAQGSPITGVQLGELSDVDVTGVTNGQLIAYNNGVWEAADDAGGAEQLNDLTDVDAEVPSAGQLLAYGQDTWSTIDQDEITLPIGSVTGLQTELNTIPDGLDDLDDVNIVGTPSEGDALVYQHGFFSLGTAGASTLDGLDDVQVPSPSSGTVLQYNGAYWAASALSIPSVPSTYYHQRYATEAETLLDGATETVELYYTAQADGDGLHEDAQSNTPSAGNVIRRKLYYAEKAQADPDTSADWTQFADLADDTTFANAKTALLAYLKERTGGTVPISLKMTWEDVAPASEFLDVYSGAEVAYSLRKLSSTYTGSAIQVRRDSDNTTQDIGFDGSGNLDETALTTFVGSGSGYVSIFYDQSGNGRNATQTSTSVQPRIVNAGTVDKINSKPAIYFDLSASQRFGRDSWTEEGKAHFSIFHVIQHYSISGDQAYYDWETGQTTSHRKNLILRDSASVSHTVDWSDPANNTPYIKSACVNGSTGDYDSYINGTQDANGTFSSYSGALGSSTNRRHGIGYRTNGSFYLRGYIQEMVVYFTDQSSQQSNMQTKINDYYSVYP